MVTPLKNFERHVRVFGSQDSEDWSPLVDDAFVFDYSEIIDVHNDEIDTGLAASPPFDDCLYRFD